MNICLFFDDFWKSFAGGPEEAESFVLSPAPAVPCTVCTSALFPKPLPGLEFRRIAKRVVMNYIVEKKKH